MTKRQTILILILFIAISYLGFSLIEQNHAREIAAMQNRIASLEEIIINFSEIKVLNDKLEAVRIEQAKIDENKWIKWIGDNRWILGIEWGD